MTHKGTYLLFFYTLVAAAPLLPLSAQTPDIENIAINHQIWGELLERHVDKKGDVDYTTFREDLNKLNEYLDYLASFDPGEEWDRSELLAFYINLYNAATVRLILQHYPVASIRDIKQPWAKKWIRLGEEELSLNQIEHKILRKMNQPRIHFAINCASASCPKLLNTPFEAQSIDKQLEEVTRDFINDPSRNQLSQENVALSAIFKWYRNDFTENGSLIDYISQYAELSIAAKAKVNYLKYDWSLNEQQ